MLCVDQLPHSEVRKLIESVLWEMEGTYDPTAPDADVWYRELVARVTNARPEMHCFVLPINGYVVAATPAPHGGAVLVDINEYYNTVVAEEADDASN